VSQSTWTLDERPAPKEPNAAYFLIVIALFAFVCIAGA
jgi:hypothetical protein